MRANWPPPLWLESEIPAKKWLGRWGGLWIAAGGTVFFLFLILVGGLLLENGAAITVGLLVGSVTVAAAFIYTMAYRFVPRDTIGMPRLLLAFGLGGLIAVALGSSFDSLLNKATGGGAHPGLTVLWLAGISEELAKILAVMAVSWKLRDKSMRNGLFLGGAVGLGFAALEDLAYAVSFYQSPPAQLHLTPILAALVLVPTRGILTPFLHPLYTALFAAALFSASRGGRFCFRPIVLVAYLGVSLAHGLWDGAAGTLQVVTGPAQYLLAIVVVLLVYPGVIVGTGLVWIKVARRARHAFHLRVVWWLAPPPSGGSPLPPGPPPGRHAGPPTAPPLPVSAPSAVPAAWAPPAPHTRA
ncbi:RsiW-degrading membrane proteinase PrsW (M82 family) [Frondihabitans sp. PhB188]|uniref:PrsW family glutamic-type intramembrane protease n=1 Tax=Frondihabitans sp. PhB188 TaxID=2485200 RepID=UPI000F463BBD|nr:PrsW family glutamic-type intramembrane protease [Frondihabitans sp. PhB188]ROQ41429.1 RsiW-degrading membrane proteinase PrsW (M82 family) [Frondihabitans sp. PhB188]